PCNFPGVTPGCKQTNCAEKQQNHSPPDIDVHVYYVTIGRNWLHEETCDYQQAANNQEQPTQREPKIKIGHGLPKDDVENQHEEQHECPDRARSLVPGD